MKFNNIVQIMTASAMVVFLSLQISTSVEIPIMEPVWLMDAWRGVLLIASIFTGIGIELVGVKAGQGIEGHWSLDDRLRTFVAALFMLCYTAVAYYIVRENEVIRLIPIILTVLYFLIPFTATMGETAVVAKDDVTRHNKSKDDLLKRNQAREDTELARQRKLEDEALIRTHRLQDSETAHKQKVQIAKINANHQQIMSGQMGTNTHTKRDDKKLDWRRLSYDQKVEVAKLSRDEIKDQYLLSTKQATRWVTNAQTFIKQMSTNGRV